MAGAARGTAMPIASVTSPVFWLLSIDQPIMLREHTCVRDYIHVADLARAHVAAARRLSESRPLEPSTTLAAGMAPPSVR